MFAAKRTVVLVASIAIQLCLGGIYAWSTIAPALHDRGHLDAADTGLVFGLTFLFFAGIMPLAGWLVTRWGSRLIVGLGGVLFGIGYLLASYSNANLLMLILSISVLSGMGIGLAYGGPLVVCIRWFPNRKGLVTGLAVGGFGAGSILLAEFGQRLLNHGWEVFSVLRLVGYVCGAVIICAAMLLFEPRRTIPSNAEVIPLPAIPRVRRDTRFWLLVAGITAGTFSGLIVIGHMKSIALDAGIGPAAAAAGVTAFAIGNLSGRVLWGLLHDRGGSITIPVSLLILSLSILFLLLSSTGPLFLLNAIGVGFGFGACFVLYFSQVVAFYGADASRHIYPKVFLSYGVSGSLGPALGGWLRDTTGSYDATLVLAFAVALSGAILLFAFARLLTMSAALKTAPVPIHPPDIPAADASPRE